MSAKHLSLIAGALALILCTRRVARPEPVRRRRSPARCRPAKEGAMEGVVVSARKAGSIVTVSVMTDQTGHYRLPHRAARARLLCALRSGRPAMISTARRPAEVEGGKAVTADLKLKADPQSPGQQLSNAEWLTSMPGTDGQKKALLNCIGCHDLDRIVRSTDDADEFMQIFERMAGYYPGSTPENPQRLNGNVHRPQHRAGARPQGRWPSISPRSTCRMTTAGPTSCRPCRGRRGAPRA